MGFGLYEHSFRKNPRLQHGAATWHDCRIMSVHSLTCRTFGLLCVAALTACTQFPALDENLSAQARAAPYPDLVPVEDLRAQLAAAKITDETTTSLEARVASLRARADRLRRTVIDRTSRSRLEKKITIEVPQE